MKRNLPSAGAAALVSFAAVCASAPRARAQAVNDRPPFTPADVAFMSGMIDHHAQAVLMAGWAPSHGASPALLELCERITVSQRDEIAAMARWLRERQQPVPDADTLASRRMAGMDGSTAGAVHGRDAGDGPRGADARDAHRRAAHPARQRARPAVRPAAS